MAWDDAQIATLRAKWAEGLSIAEIGRQMGISKNAVVGKGHRLGLPERPLPKGLEKHLARKGAGELAAAVSRSREALHAEKPAPAKPAEAKAPPAKSAAAKVRVEPKPFGKVAPCCWPIGEPRTPSFRFCDGESVAGRPYCAEHLALAFVKYRDQRESAA